MTIQARGKIPHFRNKKLLALAFTHRSYLNEAKQKTGSYERLEFLGDSILSLLTSEFLYEKFPKLSEGELTALRSLLVKTESLASVARELHLGEHLRLSRGEEETYGRENPSLLADVFEALVGALYLDSGLSSVKKFLTATLLVKIGDTAPTALKDSKSLLQELVQAKKLATPAYRILKAQGPEHRKTFTVGAYVEGKLLGTGDGHSKQEAEQRAATVALESYR